MAFYDPNTKQWYPDQSNVPPGTVVYDSSKKQWVIIYSHLGSTTPWYEMEGVYPERPTAQYTSTPVQAPADAPANISELVDPTSTEPHTLAAQLLQAQFEEWQRMFKPIELQALGQLSFNNPEVLPTALGKARTAATGASEAMGGILERQNQAMGVKPTQQQTQATNRILNLSRASAIAGAENVARENVATQDMQILLGGTPSPQILRRELNPR